MRDDSGEVVCGEEGKMVMKGEGGGGSLYMSLG
jgi:hypothetical protein